MSISSWYYPEHTCLKKEQDTFIGQESQAAIFRYTRSPVSWKVGVRQHLEGRRHKGVQRLLCRAVREGGAVHSHNLEEQDSQGSPPLCQLSI